MFAVFSHDRNEIICMKMKFVWNREKALGIYMIDFSHGILKQTNKQIFSTDRTADEHSWCVRARVCMWASARTHSQFCMCMLLAYTHFGRFLSNFHSFIHSFIYLFIFSDWMVLLLLHIFFSFSLFGLFSFRVKYFIYIMTGVFFTFFSHGNWRRHFS